ncbi:LysM peptidoglycan-binding domain-containing protein [Streptomyces sp. GQFP]|uniref:LysM peptidoglycan-binding domain-containing protein n=1 Tax=Streptomyces sp. GQFP TaxID=2907545 RepID=UPI001F431BB6|nr:transglycosylase family protein [Streptomyces sp. GQFP]UIX33521.1 LysM peptidoglycan-binding domain-containing protein [Streptomyces sp. GQFP]
MLSGNGRHRRPRQAPALLVAAGVTGSALAIPLLAATGASAASGTTWDRVAECESGGSWSANSGNGFYGGLQLTQADWEAYGGLTYAPSADQASRSQQIAVAESVLADRGAGVWEACALLSGLGKDTSSANVDTGVAETEDGASSSSSSTPKSTSTSASPMPTPTPSSSTSTDSAPSVEAKSAESSPSVKATTDVAESSPSPSPSPSGEGTSQETDSSSTGATKGEERDNSSQGAESSYTVRPGDTLCGIADSLGLEGGWSELYAENEGLLGADPNHILPGQILEVGAEPGQK